MEAIKLNDETVRKWAELLKQFRDEKGIRPEDQHEGLYLWLKEKHSIDLSSVTAAAFYNALKGK